MHLAKFHTVMLCFSPFNPIYTVHQAKQIFLPKRYVAPWTVNFSRFPDSIDDHRIIFGSRKYMSRKFFASAWPSWQASGISYPPASVRNLPGLSRRSLCDLPEGKRRPAHPRRSRCGADIGEIFRKRQPDPHLRHRLPPGMDTSSSLQSEKQTARPAPCDRKLLARPY